MIVGARVARLLGRGRRGEKAGYGTVDGGSRPYLTPAAFHEELAVLGLSCRPYGSEDYAQALATHLGLEILIDVFKDEVDPLLARELARSGKLAETSYAFDPPSAVVLIPGSLPPLSRTLALYHELGHLAAGDPTEVVEGGRKTGPWRTPPRRLAAAAPFAAEEHREREADLRAEYAALAATLGPSNPYARDPYDLL